MRKLKDLKIQLLSKEEQKNILGGNSESNCIELGQACIARTGVGIPCCGGLKCQDYDGDGHGICIPI